MTNGRAVLLAQVRAAEADLDTAERMLRDSVFDSFPERDEVLNRLRRPFDEQRQRLADAMNAATTRSAWGHLDSARLGSVGPLKEALALLGGMLLRQANLDDDVSLMADVLQRDLKTHLQKVPWPMAAVPDVEERYHRVSELIRIRFPDASIWCLPVVAHEVGHAVVAGFVEIDKGSMGNQLAFQEEFKPDTEREMVCDVIATLALGPAFVSACLLLRFMPGTAAQVYDSHPAERERAHVMLWVLRAMSCETPADFERTADWLELAWFGALEGAKVRRPPAITRSRLDKLAQKIYTATTTRLSDLPYASMATFVDLADDLGAGRDPTVSDETTMIDALNAVWLVRRRNWGEDGQLDPASAAACHRLCRAVAQASGV